MSVALLESLSVDAATFDRLTGWTMRPEGLCRGERCLPLQPVEGRVDVRSFAERTSSALVHDPESGLWALGPESGGRALSSASAPELELPDFGGNPFRVSSLRGTKVLLVAWASW